MKKRNLKDFFIGIIIVGMVFGGIGVTAVTLTAKQVLYTPEDSNFKVTDVEAAINEIYKMAESGKFNKVLLGAITNSETVSATSIHNYQNLTADNFVVQISGVTLTQSAVAGDNNTVWVHNISKGTLVNSAPSLSYNSSTGVVSVTLPRGSGGGNYQPQYNDYGSTSWSLNTTANIYCYY